MKIFFPNVTLKMIPFIKLILERSTCKKIIFSRISLSNSNVLNVNFASLFDSSNSELIRVIKLNFHRSCYYISNREGTCYLFNRTLNKYAEIRGKLGKFVQECIQISET